MEPVNQPAVPRVPPGALTNYLAFILQPTRSGLVPVTGAISALIGLGFDWQFLCIPRTEQARGPVLRITTKDPEPVMEVHYEPWHPMEGKRLTERMEVGPDTWEYQVWPSGHEVPVVNLVLRLHRSGQHRDVTVCSPTYALICAAMWGQDLRRLEVEAGLEGTELAWAVTELLTGVEQPTPEVFSQNERFRAVGALLNKYRVES